jgi:16S rRNA (uracil1498-N3)-methyltransferase
VDLFVPGIRLPRLSWLVEKATELGAGRVTIVSSARTQRERIDAADRARDRLGRIAREAAKQSGQSAVPTIAGPIPSRDVANGARAYARCLILDRSGGAFPAAMSGSIALWVGPEGGWSEDEKAAAEIQGWNRVSLPGAMLRSETAAIAGLVLALRAIDTAERLDGQ